MDENELVRLRFKQFIKSIGRTMTITRANTYFIVYWKSTSQSFVARTQVPKISKFLRRGHMRIIEDKYKTFGDDIWWTIYRDKHAISADCRINGTFCVKMRKKKYHFTNFNDRCFRLDAIERYKTQRIRETMNRNMDRALNVYFYFV